MNGEPNVIRVLVKYGAFVNTTNDEMESPLFSAVNSNNPHAVAELINLNADIKLKNNEGFTAFDLIKEIEDWIQNDIFVPKVKEILKGKFKNSI